MKKGLRRIYFEVSPTYELVNHVMTWGMDVLWRRKAAATATLEGGARWMDMCSGTGEMAAYLARRAPDGAFVVAADFSLPMLRRAAAKSGLQNTAFVLTDAGSLPFRDSTFDLITTSFATRNLNTSRDILVQRFAEFNRVLSPGGRYVGLETSQPPSKLIRSLFHLYVKLSVIPIGYAISGSRSAYSYLSNTMRSFYTAPELADILREAGFEDVRYERLMLGAAAIHTAVRKV
jgi:demethylmenaquinone methyltransferase/2-methoxy-6-polyprenyl-1,4-benzoquinol methylase